MSNPIGKISLAFSAGCIGGLINGLAVWALGRWGITANLGVHIAPTLSVAWLYPRIVWGGLWGLLFLLPMLRGRILSRGFIYSLGPTMVQLFVIFPFRTGRGLLGLHLGALTPFFVLFVNAIWGIATAIWFQTSGGR